MFTPRFSLAVATILSCLATTVQAQKVVLTRPQIKDVVVTQQFVGKILAHRHDNVRASTSGMVAEVRVKEGQAVKKGDVLSRIDSTLCELKLETELADLQIAQLELERSKKRLEQKTMSKEEVAVRQARVAGAAARVKATQAEIEMAVVRAPFDGLVGRIQEQEGSVVKVGSVLMTLFNDNTVSVEFNMSEARYLDLQFNATQFKEAPAVELVLADGAKYPSPGKLDPVEKASKSDMGRVPLRAEFPNPNHLLRHGQAGNVFLRQALKNAVVIPQRATFEVGQKRFVFVVDKEDVAHQREILVQSELDRQFVIKKGLEGRERIVLEGIRSIHAEQKVDGVFQEP